MPQIKTKPEWLRSLSEAIEGVKKDARKLRLSPEAEKRMNEEYEKVFNPKGIKHAPD